MAGIGYRIMERSLVVFQLVSESISRLPAGYVNVEDAATYLQVSDETVRRLIVDGQLEAEKQQQVHGPSGWRWIVKTASVNRLKKVRDKTS
jgi:DeoR/GlpR family transcriptional regulator of sugar metabolism